jgi:outer membrane protein assembly factor BamB
VIPDKFKAQRVDRLSPLQTVGLSGLSVMVVIPPGPMARAMQSNGPLGRNLSGSLNENTSQRCPTAAEFHPSSAVQTSGEPASSRAVTRRYLFCGVDGKSTSAATVSEEESSGWSGWRGANRDARVPWLPKSLPASADFAWSTELTGEGIGGVAAANGFVIVGSRDAIDRNDVFQCFDAETGELAWQHIYPALGRLDYGNSPRATPLIHDDCVYTLGAFGHLCCLEVDSGIMLWQVNLARDFGSPLLTWGHSGTPVIVDQKLILQPGGKDASIVALDLETGDVIWKTPGAACGYSSPLHKVVAGKSQVIGFDATTMGGWDAETGRRLWSLIPPESGDFNVPTPVSFGDRLLVTSENNGTRIYHFNDDGTIHPEPDAVNADMKPDSHTPVVSANRIFGISGALYGLDPANGLKAFAVSEDDAFAGYGCLIASDERLLAMNDEGELLLVSSTDPAMPILSRLRLKDDRNQVLAHPALTDKALFVRIGKALSRLNLE